MLAAVIPFRPVVTAARRGTWSLLEVARPGRLPEPLGILFIDEETDRLALKLRLADDFEGLEEDEADYLGALEEDFRNKGSEGRALIDSLEDSLSGFLRITDRTTITYSGDIPAAVDHLYEEHVASSRPAIDEGRVLPFVTHLPFYPLRAAATKFGDEFDAAEVSEVETWMRAPEGLRLTEGMFVAQVVGRSMEPLIPDGSYCIFRAPVTGSRQGRRLLIEQTGGRGMDGRSGSADLASRYTVKRYTSRKTENPDGTWEHESIRLEPLNREFETFDLGPGDFKVIAEFVQVLPS